MAAAYCQLCHVAILRRFRELSEVPMTVSLPAPIEAYFVASNARAVQDVAAAFAADAEVRDEGKIHRGREAIAAWKRAALGKYQMQMEPLTIERAAQTAIVTARVAGDFPGSPVRLTYRFGLGEDGITSLEIGA
ncbi:nuclear transport factor 2 family protein [Rhodopseudomonas palustris]|uniref:nuclear transport factor 2 family protein n=1 Tax=Rhodopseudomonas palustris TaxID=1076 RepID=UPI001F307331|nr:nuclear transport factor 2 family protein [Rhodopseudomonas palustris]